MPPTITVIIPTAEIPERAGMLAEALASIHGQTRLPDQVLLAHDPEHTGAGVTMNRALAKVSSEWVTQLGDDDYFLPNHIQVLGDEVDDLEADAKLCNFEAPDVYYPDCATLGLHSGLVGGAFDPERLKRGNYIPGGGSLIRTSAIRAVGGWCEPGDTDYHRYEDWVMWLRLLVSGSEFHHIPEVTWVYRFHGGATGGKL